MTQPTYVQEHHAIADVLKQYIDGGKQARSSTMKPAFSDQATLFGVDAGGQLTGGPIQGLFDTIDTAFTPSPDARAVIAHIDIAGMAASARIDTNGLSGHCFTDFFHLLKVGGQWTVVSKIYHTHS